MSTKSRTQVTLKPQNLMFQNSHAQKVERSSLFERTTFFIESLVVTICLTHEFFTGEKSANKRRLGIQSLQT